MCCCLTLALILVQFPTGQVSETVQTEKQKRLVQEHCTSTTVYPHFPYLVATLGYPRV